MQIHVLKSLWGMDPSTPLEDQLRAIKEAGYDGVEYAPSPTVDPGRVSDVCARLGLVTIAMAFADTAEDFERAVRDIHPFKPLLIAAHSGRDRMSYPEGCAYLERALAVEEEIGIPVAHETHRRRLFFSPWQTAPYLERFPRLKLLADFSHWSVVCESSLEDAAEILELSCSRAIHIHGRVGFEEGPQVPDPRSPRYRGYVERFETWWDRIRDLRAAQDAPCLTFTPEYGPPHYLHTHPRTGRPLADLWDVCLWSAKRLRRRWKVHPVPRNDQSLPSRND